MDQRPGIFQRAAGGVGSLLQGLGDRLNPRASAGQLVSQLSPIGPNLSGEWISESNVLTVASVWAAINAVSGDIASLPLRLKRRLDNGAAEVVTSHPAAKLFSRSPDGGSTTPQAFLAAWIGHRLKGGNGYARVAWASGYPVRLRVLDPTTVQVLRNDETGEVDYLVKGKEVPREEILHLVGLGEDGVSGLSPTDLCRQTIALTRAAESHASSYLGNSAIPSGIVTAPSAGSQEKNEALRKQLQEAFTGSGRYGLHVAPPGTAWTPTATDPAKSQLLELRAFQVVEMARVYRLPPNKLADYSKASYASVEQSNLQYLNETLRPICESIEAVLDLRLLTDVEVESGLYWEFDFTALLRADTATRSAWLRNMSASGLIKIDEGRAVEGLPPLPNGEGDKLMIPLNTAPLDQVLDHPKEAPK
ncbi:phage portal protein [Paludisphaera rhizosphaerae]|uniref:phage portal protein n=1 Tax=Paludisphaera rhizosphaerae TaxID=2711216 RepID=UPI0013EA320D|nr:phage portal protein [Paludisphaera rhizosphaerae]